MGRPLEKPVAIERRTPRNNHVFYDEARFHHLLRLERMRAERTGTPFFLMLVDVSVMMARWHPEGTLTRICAVMGECLREMDVRGWYDHASIIGIIFTETGAQEETFDAVMRHKINERFLKALEPAWIDTISMTCFRFPEKSAPEAQPRYATSESSMRKPLSYQPMFGFGR